MENKKHSVQVNTSLLTMKSSWLILTLEIILVNAKLFFFKFHLCINIYKAALIAELLLLQTFSLGMTLTFFYSGKETYF